MTLFDNISFSQIISFNYGIDLRLDCYCCKRGWILQEDILSSRTIHYGSDQTHWGCQTAESSESHGVWHTGVPRHLEAENVILVILAPLFTHDLIHSSLYCTMYVG